MSHSLSQTLTLSFLLLFTRREKRIDAQYLLYIICITRDIIILTGEKLRNIEATPQCVGLVIFCLQKKARKIISLLCWLGPTGDRCSLNDFRPPDLYLCVGLQPSKHQHQHQHHHHCHHRTFTFTHRHTDTHTHSTYPHAHTPSNRLCVSVYM